MDTVQLGGAGLPGHGCIWRAIAPFPIVIARSFGWNSWMLGQACLGTLHGVVGYAWLSQRLA